MFNSTNTTAGRQLLSPGKLTTQNAKLAFRRGSTASSVNGASQFVPLSTWEDNREPSSNITSLPTSLASAKATPETQADTTQVVSDASISSSSDEEFKPAARRVRRVALLEPRRERRQFTNVTPLNFSNCQHICKLQCRIPVPAIFDLKYR